MLDIKSIIQSSIDVKYELINSSIHEIKKASEMLLSAAKLNKKIIWCGNGGSAADSQHMAAELMGGLRDHNRPPIYSIALTTDTSFITAWANDTSFDTIFSRQIEAIGNPGDVLVAISTSGNSKNVINAIKIAKDKKLNIVILTGKSGGKMKLLGDISIFIPSDDTQRIQEGHLLVEHILCEYVEAGFLSNL